MQHAVLARKWRPKKFADLVGQDSSVTILKNILAAGRLHHAYLLTGTRGVGKTTIARIIAKALNCLDLQDNEPCGECNNCKQIDSSRLVDVIEIDAASNTGVDNIRELIDNAQYAPTSGQYKIYIIDEVHMLSKSAFNAMLKTLEEPPPHVIFVLATTDVQKVPITILSRCLQLKLRNLLPQEITQHLVYIANQEHVAFELPALELLATAANGSMRDALSLLDQAIAFANNFITELSIRQMLGVTEDKFIFKLLEALSNLNSTHLIETATTIYQQGHDLENVLSNLSHQLCQLSLIQLAAIPVTPELMPYVNTISINDVHLYFEIVNLGLEQMGKVNTKYPVFIMTLLRMLAFQIGSSEKKEILVSNSNFMVAAKVTDSKASNLNKQALTKAETTMLTANQSEVNNKAKEDLPKQITPQVTLKPEPLIKQFDGNWFSLINQLQPKLSSHLYPFLANAKLVSYTQNEFKLLVNDNYAAAFTLQAISDLTTIFSQFFNKQIKLCIDFAATVDNTLKEKIQEEKLQKQIDAETAIYADKNLAKILSSFSATITVGSIKPI